MFEDSVTLRQPLAIMAVLYALRFSQTNDSKLPLPKSTQLESRVVIRSDE